MDSIMHVTLFPFIVRINHKRIPFYKYLKFSKHLFILACKCFHTGDKQRGTTSNETTNSNAHIGDLDLPKAQWVTNSGEKKIISLTDTLYKGDTLKINFKIPHPKDFAITTPDGAFFFVVYGSNDSTRPPLMDWLEFENTTYLEIIADRTKANPWGVSKPKNKLIFTSTGLYEILLSENLETDDGTPVEIEKVYYMVEKNQNTQ